MKLIDNVTHRRAAGRKGLRPNCDALQRMAEAAERHPTAKTFVLTLRPTGSPITCPDCTSNEGRTVRERASYPRYRNDPATYAIAE